MLARVQRIEQARRPTSPFELWYGTLDAFTDQLHAGVVDGTYDPRDMPVVIDSIRRWHRDGVWAQ